MTELLTADEMREIEAAAFASGDVTPLEAMERAGAAVVEAALQEWSSLAEAPHRAVVLCGPGNNGGDGFVVARLLARRGWRVEVLFGDAPDRLKSEARMMHDRWRAIGEVLPLTREALHDLPKADLYVDAVFGIGLSRPPEGEIGEALRHLAGDGGDHGFFQSRLVAVDVPSGLDADSGRVLGCSNPGPGTSAAPFARLTVTFDSPKRGHVLADGPALCGRVAVRNIGFRAARERRGDGGIRTELVPPLPEVADRRTTRFRPGALLKRSGHKYGYGHAFVVSGPAARGGAVRMAARGALRAGAGLVTLGTPEAALVENAAALDAVMLRKLDTAAEFEALLEDDRVNALLLGPGLGRERGAALLPPALAARRATVLDADALTALSQDEALFGALHDRCVLTPHAGEFARLFPDLAEKLSGDAPAGPAWSRLDAARDAAARAGCTVLLKGPDTVVAAPNGSAAVSAAVYDRAAPWLATAGSGDVLAGIVSGLLARGFAPLDAAATAAWLHTEAALSFGPGLIAEDLPEELPRVLRGLARSEGFR